MEIVDYIINELQKTVATQKEKITELWQLNQVQGIKLNIKEEELKEKDETIRQLQKLVSEHGIGIE